MVRLRSLQRLEFQLTKQIPSAQFLYIINLSKTTIHILSIEFQKLKVSEKEISLKK